MLLYLAIIFNHVLYNCLGKSNYMRSIYGPGKERLFGISWSQYHYGRHVHLWWKLLKKNLDLLLSNSNFGSYGCIWVNDKRNRFETCNKWADRYFNYVDIKTVGCLPLSLEYIHISRHSYITRCRVSVNRTNAPLVLEHL